MEKKYEHYFESLLDNMIEGVAIHNMIFNEDGVPIDYKIIDTNKNYENILGLERNYVKGKLASEIYGYVPALQEYSDIVLNKKPMKFRLFYDNKYFDISSSPWNDIGFITIFSDITDNIELENTLKDSYLFTENLINTANVMIIGLDINGRVNIFNKTAEKLTGYNKDEIIGKNWFKDVKILPKDSLPMVRNVFNTLLSDDESLNITENPIITKHGEIRYILWQNNEVRKGEKVTGTISFGLDITERKIFESELIKAKERAEQSDKLKMAFLSNMSHELRTPINSIIGFSEMLKDNSIKNIEKINYLDIIIQNGDILTNLINDIIDITKIDSGTLSVQKTEIDINKLLLELKKQYIKLLKTNKVKLNIDIDLNNNIFILSDKYRLKQILMNLMSNAVKFTKKGTIKFGYNILQNNKLRIYVKDTGIGISKEDLKIIFNRFAQFDQPGESRNKGAGLGLPISKSLCEILGYGDLKIESELNKGSMFYFDIPFIIKDENYTYKEDKDCENINLENVDILIVEDDQNFRTILKSYLKSTKCKIHIDDGSDALNIITKHKINLVLLDLGLGNIDGYNILKEIKKYDKNIIVIVQSAYAISEFSKKAFDMGADDFIPKPITKTQLFMSINKFI